MKVVKSLLPMLLGAAVLAAGSVATAQVVKPLEAWKAAAATQVSDAMVDPRTRIAYADTRHVVDLLIDRSGRIIEASLLRDNGPNAVRQATEKCVERLGKLPAMPADVDGETFEIRLHLIYAALPEGIERLKADIERENGRSQETRLLRASGDSPPKIVLAATR